MTPEQIIAHAETLRREKIGMSNYQRIVNDVLVLIRELAANLDNKVSVDGEQ